MHYHAAFEIIFNYQLETDIIKISQKKTTLRRLLPITRIHKQKYPRYFFCVSCNKGRKHTVK